MNRPDKQPLKDKEFNMKINNYIAKITNLIDNFQLNVVVANVYGVYNVFNASLGEEISNESLKKNFSNLLKTLLPFTPHLASECLEELGEKETKHWPKINSELVLDEKIKMAVQINGKTRDVIEIKKNLDEKNAIIESKKNKKVSNYLIDKKIIKTIFVKNKIINYLVK